MLLPLSVAIFRRVFTLFFWHLPTTHALILQGLLLTLIGLDLAILFKVQLFLLSKQWEHLVELSLTFFFELFDFNELDLLLSVLFLSFLEPYLRLYQFPPFRRYLDGLFVIILLVD